MIEAITCWLIRAFTGVHSQWADSIHNLGTGQRIYFANHSSHLDFLVIWACLNKELRKTTRPIAAKDYWSKTPLHLWAAKNIFRAVLIERQKVSRSNNPIEALKSTLNAGESLIIFPEGTRNSGEEIGKFKSGLFHLAQHRHDLQYIPVYLENLNRALPKGEFIPLPIICSVTFGPPLIVQKNWNKNQFLSQAKAAMENLIHEL